jgi:hypothetical protein
MPRQRILVQIDGLLSVHAVRAVWTALGAVPGVVGAEVTMQGAVLETDGPLDQHRLEAVLAMAGVQLRSLHIERASLPLL